MSHVRTTLTLDEDLAERLKETAHRERRSFKEVVNDAIRAGMGAYGKTIRTRPFTVRTFRSRLKAGIDEGKLNQLADQLEADSFLAESTKR